MCSIIAGFDLKKIRELINQNIDRGCLSYSFSVIDKTADGRKIHVFRFRGEFDEKNFKGFVKDWQKKDNYYIVHMQAPTSSGAASEENIHPAEQVFSEGLGLYLWHNGMMLEDEIPMFKERYSRPDTDWDTELLLEGLQTGTVPAIRGSMACLYWNADALYAFRNNNAPLWVDDSLTMSSTEFEGSKQIQAGTRYLVGIANKHKSLVEIEKFEVTDSFYFLAEALPEAGEDDAGWLTDCDPNPPLSLEAQILLIPKTPVTQLVLPESAPEFNWETGANVNGSLVPYKFNEGRHLRELTDYINKTYSAHYGKKKLQANEVIMDNGHGEGFFLGNVQKYAARYGIKNGRNKDDLMKILHYTILMLEQHDQNVANTRIGG